MSATRRMGHDRPMNPAPGERPAQPTAPHTEHVVDALIGARLLDPSHREQSLAVVAGVLDGGPDREDHRRNLPRLVEVVAYLGGALVLAAGALFLSEQWAALGFAPRVALLAMTTAVLLVAGAVAAKVPAGEPELRDAANDIRRRLAGALLTFGALTAAFLVGLVLDHSGTYEYPGIYWPAVAGAVVGVLVAAVGYRLAPTALGLVGILGGVLTLVMNLIDRIEWAGSEGDTAGLMLFATGVAWLVLTELGVFREVTVARALGAATTLLGAQVPAIDGTHAWLGYALTLFVAVAGIVIYLRSVAWPYLAVSLLAVTLLVPEAVVDWTAGSLGAVGGVLIAGITLLLASYAGFRIRAEGTD